MSVNISVPKGIYTHYKGKNYEVIGHARHSETQEPLVVYKALYQGDFPEDLLWVRPRDMFLENVVVEGKTVPRFRLIQDMSGDDTKA